MHQEDTARAALVKYGAGDFKPVDTTVLVRSPLNTEPWGGMASDRGTPEFAMFMGDLTSLTR